MCIDGVVEEALRDGKTVVTEGLSGRMGGTKVDGRQTAVDVTESQGNTTLMSFDNILKRRLRAARETWDDEMIIGGWTGWRVKCSTFEKLLRGHGGFIVMRRG